MEFAFIEAQPPAFSLAPHAIESFADPDHQNIEPGIGQKDVRAQPEHENVDARLLCLLQSLGEIFRRSGQQYRRGTADPVSGITRQRDSTC